MGLQPDDDFVAKPKRDAEVAQKIEEMTAGEKAAEPTPTTELVEAKTPEATVA